MKHLDKIANLAVIVGVIVFLVLVYRGEFGRQIAPESAPQNIVGETVSLPGIKLPRDRNTLILAVSATCHFCKESVPFYKQIEKDSAGRLNIVAVLPQPMDEAQKFLRDEGLETNQVVSARLDVIGVRGTPTVLLVDANGKVKHAWKGTLDEKGQQDLLATALPGP